MACQPWMIEAGLYVAQEDFWMPEVLGLGLPSDALASGPPAPVAFFTAAPTVGDYPLAVSFFNLSTGAEGATFLWDFGD
jgi:PKD repeat protein